MVFSRSLRHKTWRPMVLFLLTVVVPCATLLGLGLRMVAQDRELAEKRAADDFRREAADLRTAILQRLDALRAKAVGTVGSDPTSERDQPDPPVALVARIVDGRLELPWEADPTGPIATQLLNQDAFLAALADAEHAEFVEKRPAIAAARYRKAEQSARHELQRAYAGLLRARALAASPVGTEGDAIYEQLATSSLDLRDEHGVPLALYAAERLVSRGRLDAQRLFELVSTSLERRVWSAPPEAYLLKQLTRALVDLAPAPRGSDAVALDERVARRLDHIERALTLQRDLAGIRTAVQSSSPTSRRWIAHGEPPWLVTITPAAVDRAEEVFVAVHASRLIASIALGSAVSPRQVHIATPASSSGIPLGEELSGLHVAFGTTTRGSAASEPLQRLYLPGLALVLSFAMFGGYLLWRDTQREVRLVALRSQFVASVSHELKTPLTAIRMFAETLSMGRPVDTRTRHEYLETIVLETERLSRLLDNVLDFSKIEQDRKTYHLAMGSLADVVSAAARILQHPLAQHGFELRLHIDEQLPPVRMDADAIEQAVLNLLSNATKYSGTGRVIDLRLERQGGDAVISVTDRGAGLPSHEHQRIFEKFYRAPTPENRTIPGAGLGLSLAQHVVLAHGGRIAVKSAPGHGSTFAIHLRLENVDNPPHTPMLLPEELARRS